MNAVVTLEDVRQTVDLLIAVHTPEELRRFYPSGSELPISAVQTFDELVRLLAWWCVTESYPVYPKSIETALQNINASKETK